MAGMEIVKTEIDGVVIINNPVFNDLRGSFIKVYNEDMFKKYNLCTDFKESYYTISKKDVIRGMHFQKPPYDHEKLVYVAKGKIIDVILDLRKNSKTYKKFITVELTEHNRRSVYIPEGFAHGFKSMESETIVVYQVATVYNRSADSGIRWNSFGMNWNVDNPVISNRDKSFEGLNEFKDLW